MDAKRGHYKKFAIFPLQIVSSHRICHCKTTILLQYLFNIYIYIYIIKIKQSNKYLDSIHINFYTLIIVSSFFLHCDSPILLYFLQPSSPVKSRQQLWLEFRFWSDLPLSFFIIFYFIFFISTNHNELSLRIFLLDSRCKGKIYFSICSSCSYSTSWSNFSIRFSLGPSSNFYISLRPFSRCWCRSWLCNCWLLGEIWFSIFSYRFGLKIIRKTLAIKIIVCLLLLLVLISFVCHLCMICFRCLTYLVGWFSQF